MSLDYVGIGMGVGSAIATAIVTLIAIAILYFAVVGIMGKIGKGG